MLRVTRVTKVIKRRISIEKKVIAYQDDASRYILAIGEFEHAIGTTTERAKHL